jgi:signal transduction histidine kinase/ActR/RegA family two-component response regulator
MLALSAKSFVMPPSSPFLPARLEGDMARRIADHAWQTHALGLPDQWPQSLRHAVALLLECKLPMYLAWGPGLIQFYNDAYRPILGDKHEGALGGSARDTWCEIWPTIGPMWDAVLQGKAIGFDDYKLTIERYGFPEDCYFNFSYSPVRDDDGIPRGVLVTFAETTAKVLSERRFRFLDELAQLTRVLSDPAEVMQVTASMLGKYLGVNRCAYAHVLEDQNTFDLIGDYNEGVASIVGRYKFTDFGQQVGDLMIANEPYVNEDVETHSITRDLDLVAYRLTQIRAVICVPLHKSGRFVAAMAVHQTTPRNWNADEISLVRTVVDRCWESLERIRAERDKALLLDSERAARQDAERANSFKDNFLATLSHELRTPLTAITGWVHILRRKYGSTHSDLAKGIDVIERSTRSQARLIGDLLDMSRISSGKLHMDMKPMDLATCVRTAYELILPNAHTAGLAVGADVAPVGTVLGDVDRLQQVVTNLLSNAIKFTPRGGSIHLRLSHEGNEAVIAVSDNGIGINAEFLPHVFKRFRQADGSITRTHSGLGLGLSIVQHIVELHGGTVAAQSLGAGTGASFRVSLPLYASTSEDPSLSAGGGPAEHAAPRLAGRSVLVVDDDPDTRDLLRRVIEECGAQVYTAHDAYEAMDLIEAHHPDVVCSDIGMPGMNGYELLRWLRNQPPERSGLVPAIAMTAFARAEDRERSLSSGFHCHLSKPLEPLKVLAAIEELLAPRQI